MHPEYMGGYPNYQAVRKKYGVDLEGVTQFKANFCLFQVYGEHVQHNYCSNLYGSISDKDTYQVQLRLLVFQSILRYRAPRFFLSGVILIASKINYMGSGKSTESTISPSASLG